MISLLKTALPITFEIDDQRNEPTQDATSEPLRRREMEHLFAREQGQQARVAT